MFGLIRKRLGNEILAVIIITIVFVLGIEIVVRLHYGMKDRTEIMEMYCSELALSVHSSFIYPMSVGDSDGIARQLSEIREKIKDVEVHVCDSNKKVAYSTHQDAIKTTLSASLYSEKFIRNLDEVLTNGGSQKLFLDEIRGERYLFIIHPLLNETGCYRCHGSSRKILGGMILKIEANRTYAQVSAARNRTILLGLFSISAITAIIYTMLTKLIRRPVENLAEKAKRFAEGDMSVSVDVTAKNEIGVLGNTFNYMVDSISSFSRKLEREVTRKTNLLNERTELLTLLERANRELRELDKLKSTFLANMSHELRTPMNAIIGYTELLLDGVDGPINEEQEKSLHKVVSNAKHLLQLINDVLDISKIESGKVELHPREIDLKWVTESVLPTFEPMIRQKGLSIRLDFDESLPPVFADEDKVAQILINLLSNAVKFTNKGGIAVTAHASDKGIKAGAPPLFVEVCIEDTGIGIKEEDMSKLFDKFSQLDISSTRQYEGTGLGLSIARGLVVLHKGVIWVTSEYGKGSRFLFTLPARREVLEKSAEPAIETLMAEGLSSYFNTATGPFLKEPRYAGSLIRCWEYFHCGQTSCPGYGSEESRCWLIIGTHCRGTKVASYPEKVDFCKGCEIIERLLLETDELYEMDKVVAEAEECGSADRKKCVLSVDDNPEAVEIIRKYLGKDYHVVGLVSSENVVEKVKEIKPLAITLDIMMPVKDGWQVLRELKSTPETQDIPVIILSIIDEKQLGFSLGAAEYIVKPIEKDILLRKLKNLEKMAKINRILIVDNERDAVKLIGTMLTEAGYEVMEAYTSEEAVDAMRGSKPDLIVLNLTMPEVSGVDVIEHMKADDEIRNIPLIIVTQRELTERQMSELNGRIQGILNRAKLTTEGLLKEIKETISKCDKS
ncbi:MAG TPA: response regulator [Candidatus Sulfobium mesophilum]|nr:response regulator [Candidatus Sulfobium mesophilum]